ncbi:MAG: DNA-binding protein HRm [Candidatus Ordinivivax streblomastigis]|jgi:DNA-binding protein HU-beta|uniref:DNA-binding protein HRm n=1 Tax=Candidatus Ordinivivax streblomastigis TaxID=2540710 RepID=A0A5M8P394_9BACT|nr:MAG: DNA-binding protein HRm [Candidatus Ordinivivax streblomastigis]
MNKRELIAAIAAKSGITQSETQARIEPVLKCMLEALKNGNKIVIHNFGTFSVKEWKERNKRNPSTNTAIICPAKRIVKFQVTKRLIL